MSDVTETFERIYAAIATSPVYRAAAIEQMPALAQWVAPFGTTTAELAYHTSAYPYDETGTALDLGCGTGGLTLWVLRAAHVVGIDASPSAIAAANRLASELGRTNVTFVVGSAERTGLADASIAHAISFDAMMFFDAPAVARELARILRPNARFIFTTTEWCGAGAPPVATLERDYGAIFEAAGFTIDTRDVLDRRRGLPLYRALLAREDALRSELGAVAEILLAEARDRVAEPAEQTSVRDRFYVMRNR